MSPLISKPYYTVEFVRWLLTKGGGGLTLSSRDKKSPLAHAAGGGHVECALMLLDKGNAIRV
jgi:hypothetical protein